MAQTMMGPTMSSAISSDAGKIAGPSNRSHPANIQSAVVALAPNLDEIDETKKPYINLQKLMHICTYAELMAMAAE